MAGTAIPIRASADQMIAYGVANFGGPGQCTGNKSHSLHSDTPNEFAEVFQAMMAAGKWNTASVRIDMAVRGSLFTDPAKVSTCTKSSCSSNCSCAGEDDLPGIGADTADVFFIHTHGSHKTDTPRSSLAMGNFGFDCSVTTNQNMSFNGGADIAVVKACQSADREVWQMGGYASGHLLHTRLARAEIERRALDALSREGVTDGAVALRWRYLATRTATGEVTLRLSVAARVPGVRGVEADEEPRDLDVDVSPVE